MEEQLVYLLQKESKPALGVTEVGAIALASAHAYTAVGGDILNISLVVNGGLYKNAFSCAIPNTEEIGNEMAALLGAICGDPQLGLQSLSTVAEKDVALAKDLLKKNPDIVTISVKEQEEILVEALVETTLGKGFARILTYHWNVVLVKKEDTVVFEKPVASENKELSIDFDALDIEDFYNFAKTVPIEKIRFLQEMIDGNKVLSEKGAKGVGLGIYQTLYNALGEGGNDPIYAAQRLTVNAMDARLAGLPFPAMSIAGSGSHGILCSLPIVSYGECMGKEKEEVLRALSLSCLLTIYSKYYTGRLSPLCGCVLGGGTGAACGIVYLMGGGVKEIGAAINHMAANLTGMICDGGSIGCSLKASTGVYTAFLSAFLAIEGKGMPSNFGILGSTPKQTIKNLGRVSKEGMGTMDMTTIDIMQKGE